MDKPIDKSIDSDSLATTEKWHLRRDNESAARRALYAARAHQDRKSLERV